MFSFSAISLYRRFPVLLAALFVFIRAFAQSAPPPAPNKTSPPPIPAISTNPGSSASVPSSFSPPHIPETPWYGDQPLPSEAELKTLQAARDAVEKDLTVVIANKTYAERFGAADDLVRTRIFADPATNNPDYQDALRMFRLQQVLFATLWDVGGANSRDILLPDPQHDRARRIFRPHHSYEQRHGRRRGRPVSLPRGDAGA